MGVRTRFLTALVVAAASPGAWGAKTQMKMLANPIRKVVKMLQTMQAEVTKEGEKADELFEKYMCYCKNSGGDLAGSVEGAGTKIEELGPAIEAATNQKDQLAKDVESHQEDKATAQKALDEATALRQKEKAAFDKAMADSKANLAACKKATKAVQQGLSGSFLQTPEAGVLRAYLAKAQGSLGSLDEDHQAVLSFLSDGAIPPSSLAVIGVLQNLEDEMTRDQKEMAETEDASVQTHDELLAAKTRELHALTKAIQDKLERIGRLGIEIASMKNDLGDTQQMLAEDQAFLGDMKKNCASKKGIHEEEKKMRGQEVVALAETIEILNKDDALELFKKTLPSAGSSFLQLQTTAASMRTQARNLVAKARSKVRPGHGAERLDFISLALSGRKVGLEKVVNMVDKLIGTLEKEQQADDEKKKYCSAELGTAGDKKKALQRSVSDVDTAIAETKESISTLTDEIADLQKGIAALDKSVAEATQQRQQENKEYKELMASNGAAKELIVKAKTRMGKFYGASLLQAGVPPPPETAAAYTKKGSGGVLSMMTSLVGDLDREMAIERTQEKLSQEAYMKTMADSKEKRTIDAKSLSDREGAKADMKRELQTSHAVKKSTLKELRSTEEYLASLRSDCDWLMQYYDVRKEARSDEVDSLKKAKDVLSGADLALVQLSSSHVRTHKFLHQRAV